MTLEALLGADERCLVYAQQPPESQDGGSPAAARDEVQGHRAGDRSCGRGAEGGDEGHAAPGDLIAGEGHYER